MLIWVGWPNSEEVCKFDGERERKSKQVYARPGQTESLVNPSVQLAVPKVLFREVSAYERSQTAHLKKMIIFELFVRNSS